MKALKSAVRSALSPQPAPTSNAGTKPLNRRTKEQDGKKAAQLEKHDIRADQPESKKKSPAAQADAKLVDVINALVRGKLDNANEALKASEKLLQAVAKKLNADPDVVRTSCRTTLTRELPNLDDEALVDMEHNLAALMQQHARNAVLGQFQFSLRAEHLSRVMRSMEEEGLDLLSGDLSGFAELKEADMATILDLATDLARSAKDSPALQAELASKQLPWDQLQTLGTNTRQALADFKAQKEAAIKILNMDDPTPIQQLPHAKLKLLREAFDVLRRAVPKNVNDPADPMPGKQVLRLLHDEILAAEQAIIAGLNLGNLNSFNARGLTDDRLGELYGEMSRLAYVPKKIQGIHHAIRLEVAGRALVQADGDPAIINHASVAKLETLISHVNLVLPETSKSPEGLSLLQAVSESLMQVAVAKSALATKHVADALERAEASTAAVATAADHFRATEKSTGSTKPKSKARTKAESDEKFAADGMRAAVAKAKDVSHQVAKAEQAAAAAKKVAADAVKAADDVAVALAKATARMQSKTSATATH